MTMTTAKGGVLFKQTFLHIEAKMFRFIVQILRIGIGQRKLIDMAILIQDFEKRFAFELWIRG